MFGLRLIFILAVMGGIIAFIADKLGSKIGKKKMTILGLRPHDTSVLLTVLSGVLITACTIGILSASSNSARVALFGMEKLQREMAELNSEKSQALDDLHKALADVQEKNAAIAELDEKIRVAQAAKDAAEGNLTQAQARLLEAQGSLERAQEQYTAAQGALIAAKGEVASLTEVRTKLNAEVKKLEAETSDLRKGIMTIREGQVVYRSGEIVFAGVLKSGQNEEETQKQLQWLLTSANKNVFDRLGIKNTENTDIVWIGRDDYAKVLKSLREGSGDILVRVRAVANTLAGEPVVCSLDANSNKKIYGDGELIYRKVVAADGSTPAETLLIDFLTDVNKLSVDAGVLPDPLTGKVGNMDAASIIEAVKKVQKLGGKVVVSAYAKGEITSAGPVLLRLEVDKIADST